MPVEIAVKMLKNLNKVAKRRKNTLIFVVFTLINYCLYIFNRILKKLYYLCTYKKRRQQHPLILLTTSCVKPLFWGWSQHERLTKNYILEFWL